MMSSYCGLICSLCYVPVQATTDIGEIGATHGWSANLIMENLSTTDWGVVLLLDQGLVNTIYQFRNPGVLSKMHTTEGTLLTTR